MNFAPVSALASAVGMLTNAKDARIARINEPLFIQLSPCLLHFDEAE